ncbi:MAG: sigma 54-interacting transcriptional regulator, partial [Myxococcales bacterium]
GTDTPVLIQGESGTGKELCAASVHRRSIRRDGPFVAVRAGLVGREQIWGELFGADGKPGKLEQASGGTLFLDEVHTLDARAQAALLQVLESRQFERASGEAVPVDVRLVVTTSRDLGNLVAAGEFREDLLYRLNVFQMTLPPLRERPEDIGPLAAMFAADCAQRLGKNTPVLTSETESLLARYPWPGNVRQLRNVIEHAVILCQGAEITRDLLPRMLQGDDEGAKVVRIPVGTTMKDVEREMIARTLDANNWNKNRVARILGISRRSLYNKLERYRIVAPPKNDPPVTMNQLQER